MKLSVNILLVPFVLLILLSSYLALGTTHTTFIYRLIWLPTLLLVPGFLISLSLKFRSAGMWTYLFHSLGLSIGCIYLLGFIASFLLPLFGFSRPLDLMPFVFLYEGFVTVLLMIAMYKNRNNSIEISDFAPKILKLLAYFVAIGISMVGVAGALYLNNTGNNIVSLTWLFILVIGLFISTFFQNRSVTLLRPYFILILSLSVLWMLSARSWNLVGWDIVEETVVAKTTLSAGRWSLKDIRDAYNACLSISILPTVISNVTTLPVEFLYKFIYPFIFGHFPLLIYFWAKKIVSKDLSFFAVIYIIAQPFFNQSMVGLARQEIAFLFFPLLLFTIFSDHLRTWTKNALILFYIAALVTSHYSTTYVAIILFACAYAVIFTLSLIKRLPLDKWLGGYTFYKNWVISYKSKIKWWMVAFLVGFTYLWYFLFTNSAGNVQAVITKSLSEMTSLFNNEQISQEVRNALPGVSNVAVTTIEDLRLYEHAFDTNVENLKPDRVYELFAKYPLRPLYEYVVPPSLPINGNQVNQLFTRLKDLLKILLIIGAFIQLLKTFRNARQNLDLVIFSCVSAGLLLVMLFHPTLGLQYNISRIYLQLMVFLALSLMVGLDTFMWLLKTRFKNIVFGLVLFPTLLFLQGALVPFLGGIPVLQLYQIGTDYEKSYVYQAELATARWLQKNRNFKNGVYGDNFSGLRIRNEAYFFPKNNIVPLVLENDASGYVYVSNTNLNGQKAIVIFQSKVLTYEYPLRYLNDNRSRIYSNSKSEIFK